MAAAENAVPPADFPFERNRKELARLLGREIAATEALRILSGDYEPADLRFNKTARAALKRMRRGRP